MAGKRLLWVAFATVACLCAFPNTVRGSAEKSEHAKAECVMEAESRRILFAYNAEERLPMASTTKILTAITVLERVGLHESLEIPKEAVGVEGSSVYLKAGERYSVEDLLYGLMLRSGNDCAEALALYTAGSKERFASAMNETALKAGALESHFVTPHGLHHVEHFTTAKDLSFITCYALQNDDFAKIVATRYYEPRGWKNKNKLLSSFEGAIGVKTGYTKNAGKCLVSAARREGMTLVCTVLSCADTYERSAVLLQDAFSAYRRMKILSTETPVEVRVGDRMYTGRVAKDLYYPLLEEEHALLKRETVARNSQKKSFKKGEIIGEIRISLLNQLIFSENLYKL